MSRPATILLAAMLAALAGCKRKDGPAPVVMGTPAAPYPHPSFPSRPAAPAHSGALADRPNVVVVQRGETLYSVARRYDVPIRSVIEANNLSPPYYLIVGQNLKIPQVRQYIVQPGDSLKTVSRKFGVDASTLAATNKLPAPYTLKSGQALILPAAVVPAPPPPVQTASKPPAPASAPATAVASVAAPPAAGKPQQPVRQAPEAQEPPAQTSPSQASASPPALLPEPRPGKDLAKEMHAKEKEKKPVTASAKPPVAVPSDAPSLPPQSSAPEHVLIPPAEEPRLAMAPPPQQPAPQASAKPQPPVPAEAEKDAEEPEESAEPAPAPRSAAGFQWPVRGPILTGFGPGPTGMQNDGINLAAALGTPVAAANDGEVAYVGNELRGYGNLVLLKHPDGWMTAYAHLDGIAVKPHEHVKRGQVIAHVGKTGAVAEPQLHFEMRRGTRALDPANYLPSFSAAR